MSEVHRIGLNESKEPEFLRQIKYQKRRKGVGIKRRWLFSTKIRTKCKTLKGMGKITVKVRLFWQYEKKKECFLAQPTSKFRFSHSDSIYQRKYIQRIADRSPHSAHSLTDQERRESMWKAENQKEKLDFACPKGWQQFHIWQWTSLDPGWEMERGGKGQRKNERVTKRASTSGGTRVSSLVLVNKERTSNKSRTPYYTDWDRLCDSKNEAVARPKLSSPKTRRKLRKEIRLTRMVGS